MYCSIISRFSLKQKNKNYDLGIRNPVKEPFSAKCINIYHTILSMNNTENDGKAITIEWKWCFNLIRYIEQTETC